MITTGGTSLRNDILRLHQDVHVLVGTVGRIIDLANKGLANLSQCKMCIMDEADKLLDEQGEPLVRQLLTFMGGKPEL